MRRVLSTLVIAAVVVGLMLWASAWVSTWTAPEPYIVVEYLGLEFSEVEYHERVRGQIERDGWGFICVQHLLSRTSGSEARSVNSARQNLVYVEECALAEASNNDGDLQAGP